MPEDKSPAYESYPQTDAILDSKQRRKCQALFKELEILKDSIKTQEDRAQEIMKELDAFQYMVDAPGIRFGQLAYSIAECKGRRSLSEALLMGNGVAKDVIDACYKVGRPYKRRTFDRIEEKEGLPE